MPSYRELERGTVELRFQTLSLGGFLLSARPLSPGSAGSESDTSGVQKASGGN